MNTNTHLASISIALLALSTAMTASPAGAANTGSATTPSTLKAPLSACELLTQAQIGTAVGTAIATGTPSTATVCTWLASKPEDSAVKYVTLTLQGLDAFDGGKQAATMSSSVKLTSASVSGGDEAYYLAVGNNVGLVVKKGSTAFKVAVYATVSLGQKQAMEMTLAKDVAAKM